MRPTRLRGVAASTAALAAAFIAVLAPVTTAQAADECTARTTTQAFAAFGDTNEYFPINAGTFESGDLSPFTLTGAPSIAAENEPWRVLGPSHARSVALPPGASLRASFCVQVGEDSLRAFVKSPGGSGNSLRIKATVATAYGSASSSTSSSTRSAEWAPTSRLPLTNVAGPDGKQYVTLVVTNAGTGTWLLDDVLVDPWKTK